MSTLLQKLINVFNLSKILIKDGHSIRQLVNKTLKVFKSEGLQGIKLRIRAINRHRISAHDMAVEMAVQDSEKAAIESVAAVENAIKIIKKAPFIPHYFDPAETIEAEESVKTAVHLHAQSMTGLLAALPKFGVLPNSTDIYLSCSFVVNREDIKNIFLKELPDIGQLTIAEVPKDSGALLPLLVEFIDVIALYNVIGHFHTSHNSYDSVAFNSLLGASVADQQLSKIFALLKKDATSVFNGTELITDAPSQQWKSALQTIHAIIKDQVKVATLDAAHDLPTGTMFWSKPEIFNDWLSCPLTYQHFSTLMSGQGEAITHVIKATVCLLSQESGARHYYLPTSDTLLDFTQYEEQHDYSDSIAHDDIQMLTYYLPQFHPIPENDLWHGKGFTEWTKVRAANPLFKGHYQQQIPHDDIGYYLLDSPETLRHQAAMMEKSGVRGQIFYHYWFGGKMILEEPAQMLLANADIDMPFSFCWANENWTMRWDGDDNNVLLAQNYSEEDARAFIQYLIPFFLDKRYIKIEGRPALWVYRPSHIKDVQQYIDVWTQECAKHDLPAPYVVAVLTRGIDDPHAYAMDAGVERVLHDWTAGIVPDIKPKLEKYHEMTGGVLDYNQVADFYEAQTESKDFTYFRSLVPIWDNTARYNERAILLHGGSPERFQQWLESSIAYSQKNLTADKRFVVINAWNEWAEGAHLEPDTCHGYGYLNAIGRALSNIRYGEEVNYDNKIVSDPHLHIELQQNVIHQLSRNKKHLQQFVTCLRNSTLLQNINFSVAAGDLITDLGTQQPPDGKHPTLRFSQVVLFTDDALEDMFKMWQQCSTSAIIPNHYMDNAQESLLVPTANGSIDRSQMTKAPFVLSPAIPYKNVRICTRAQSFALPESRARVPFDTPISTVIRFHEEGDFKQLRATLYCLAAMQECAVTPIIAAQGLSIATQSALDKLLMSIPFAKGVIAKIIPFANNKAIDLRSKMLNESLQQVDTRYATFLDHDDLLMADAYSWLLNRLCVTSKAVAFGRVFKTDYQAEQQLLLKRVKQFEFGACYEDFLYNNHAPLHSFMLDLSQLNVTSIKYHDEHKYMEDYFLTLQLFNEDNCDWDSLSFNKYLGDYIYSVDREHTLAFNQESDKTDILQDDHYAQCEQRVNDLRQPIYQALKIK